MRYILLLLVLTSLVSCSKDDSMDIPYAYVRYTFTEVEFQALSTNNILLVKNSGVAGLVIRKDGNQYVAFDRCSSVNPEKRCAVVPDESGFTATDPCSGAVFSLFDGSPAKAPAKRSLRQYSVYGAGSQFTVSSD